MVPAGVPGLAGGGMVLSAGEGTDETQRRTTEMDEIRHLACSKPLSLCSKGVAAGVVKRGVSPPLLRPSSPSAGNFGCTGQEGCTKSKTLSIISPSKRGNRWATILAALIEAGLAPGLQKSTAVCALCFRIPTQSTTALQVRRNAMPRVSSYHDFAIL
ncbi:hypothetical protein BU16DRAFT_542253 [Lophium mytilinum]|uniref:Uncharacterized protein n=1 Tax=Lophium mytilinum TaxID=390894 RepID=A0A6A6QK12_9PEZI|nr:hypothetical protein BU16DRAFT_542253 [Lophium mytilinum]